MQVETHPQIIEVFEELGIDFMNQYPRKDEIEFTRIPILYVKVPPKATPKMLASEILSTIGDPLNNRGTSLYLTSRVHKYVAACHVEVIIIDEYQHLIGNDLHPVLNATSNWVKTFAEECTVPIVLCSMPESDNIFYCNKRRWFKSTKI